jgi:transposase
MDGSTACMAIEGATDTEVFRAYVSEVLCPILRPGDLVVMDNLAPHKSEPTLALIRETGAEVLFLPAYSPDLNPIEQMWSKVKSKLAACRRERGNHCRKPSARPWLESPPRTPLTGLPIVVTTLFKML